MFEILAAAGTAFWLGILTSISPCPLSSNIAALSFLSRQLSDSKSVFGTGLFYTLGRMVSYFLVGLAVIYSFTSVPAIANFLQKYMNKILGPVLVIVGLFLLEVFRLNLTSFAISAENQEKLARSGRAGSFILGFIFALAFCPVSAALFFGGLIPLALSKPVGILLPLVYGFGTALPVAVSAVILGFSMQSIGAFFNKVRKVEYWTRIVTGIIFIVIGIYFIKNHFFSKYF